MSVTDVARERACAHLSTRKNHDLIISDIFGSLIARSSQLHDVVIKANKWISHRGQRGSAIMNIAESICSKD